MTELNEKDLSKQLQQRIRALSIDFLSRYRSTNTLEGRLNFNTALTILSIASGMTEEHDAAMLVNQAISIARNSLGTPLDVK